MQTAALSLSARRAWIEILQPRFCGRWFPVALRKESVDRNDKRLQVGGGPGVALRKESVDRNIEEYSGELNMLRVALRKESVDRNGHVQRYRQRDRNVALRKESVDRNTQAADK